MISLLINKVSLSTVNKESYFSTEYSTLHYFSTEYSILHREFCVSEIHSEILRFNSTNNEMYIPKNSCKEYILNKSYELYIVYLLIK
jgi:hypothetical protein